MSLAQHFGPPLSAKASREDFSTQTPAPKRSSALAPESRFFIKGPHEQ